MRFYCKQKELRRQRMYEKALDACATSPFARGISRWVLAGKVGVTAVSLACWAFSEMLG